MLFQQVPNVQFVHMPVIPTCSVAVIGSLILFLHHTRECSLHAAHSSTLGRCVIDDYIYLSISRIRQVAIHLIAYMYVHEVS
jgi:hypothetical protein